MLKSSLIGRILITLFATLHSVTGMTDPPKINYDEQQVPEYSLPDPLIDDAGRPVKTPQEWQMRRRPEILRLFETHVYGRAPQPPALEFDVQSESTDALDGNAIRKEVAIHLLPRAANLSLHLLLYLPKCQSPVPVFLGLNFWGNQCVHADPDITVTKAWVRNDKDLGVENNRANDLTRACEAERWQVEQVLKAGFGVATMYYGDIDPDFDDGFTNGVHSLYPRSDPREGDAWGSIAAWAWGLSRAMDYLQTDSRVDSKQVAVWGHSRLGKTALWAAAQDERFAMAISNNSGCGGAALSRRLFGETVARINTQFPHWFCKNFHRYNGREGELPVDQHMLIALVAPRPVYIASAAEDLWADPRGEFLAAKGAAPVYEILLGAAAAALPSDMPTIDESVGKRIGYHIRSGKHDVTAYDWQQYLQFAKRHLDGDQ
jgi:hypothetical protein